MKNQAPIASIKKIKNLKRTKKQEELSKILTIDMIKGDGRKSAPLTVILHPTETRINVAQFRRILHGVVREKGSHFSQSGLTVSIIASFCELCGADYDISRRFKDGTTRPLGFKIMFDWVKVHKCMVANKLIEEEL